MEREERPPSPDSTVPFEQDLDFIYRVELNQLDQKLSHPSARVVLVGIGGVGYATF